MCNINVLWSCMATDINESVSADVLALTGIKRERDRDPRCSKTQNELFKNSFLTVPFIVCRNSDNRISTLIKEMSCETRTDNNHIELKNLLRTLGCNWLLKDFKSQISTEKCCEHKIR